MSQERINDKKALSLITKKLLDHQRLNDVDEALVKKFLAPFTNFQDGAELTLNISALDNEKSINGHTAFFIVFFFFNDIISNEKFDLLNKLSANELDFILTKYKKFIKSADLDQNTATQILIGLTNAILEGKLKKNETSYKPIIADLDLVLATILNTTAIKVSLFPDSTKFTKLIDAISVAETSTKNKFLGYIALFEIAKQGYRGATLYFNNSLELKAKDFSNLTDLLGYLVIKEKMSLRECFNLLPTDAWKERVLDFALANYRIDHIKMQLVDILSKPNKIEINDYNKILNLAANKSSNRPSGSSFRLFVIPDFFLSRKDMIQKGIRKIAAIIDINNLINNINQPPKIKIQYENEDSITSEKAKLVTSQELIKTPLTPKADRAKGDIKSIKAELSSTVATDSRFRQALQKIAGFFRHLFGLKSTTVKASDENKVNLKIKETTTERSVKVK